MISIFVLLFFIVIFTVAGWRRTAIALYFFNLILAAFVFWLHMTDALKINW